ncbi:MAG: hypothetical protein A2Y28_02375 [Chlamydiae bacterium GWC2_50_10]|nr:MAG: hypothetical protein A2Z85_01910 [Chlamydiae bacterium GWA2_50_15]OGN54860.1 MAG: hypothetical protein A2Y28_02375 [Chlamydiae bacterium GWC2_50_10]OGN58427.1 MAG: hypothetical protein A3D18_00845 [Chlamydiae bacterium RIFCSPHIGHO2_02_FULL_49_29]OGN64461.1 MAG: hypothetical protein A3E26_03680 [Chlamydiae bacterium RIFCSPHIGHO2_12_FULL_49_32]OGN71340.1 MAG: hypothetical protein A3I15_03900 [Chlamydiae bacterium RIFCSPLOWO2_02_FULL_49_12]OGN74123.1 MAG: hypothetical protein A3G30_02900 
MIRIPGKIPILIHPTFFLIAALIGFLNSMTLVGTVIWIVIILVSVLIHEFGHALTATLFGLSPRIELVALGGLTYHEGGGLKTWKQFLIVFNGPLFGFFLFLFGTLLVQIPPVALSYFGSVLQTFRLVNLFWTVLNLVPVLPLDGGQLLRIVLEGVFGVKGFRYALAASMMVAVALSLLSFLFQAFLIGAIFFLFAFSSFDAYRRTRHISEPDRSEELKKLLEEAEKALEEGRKAEAEHLLSKVLSQAKRGMLHTLAVQHLGFLKYEQGNHQEAYALLRSIRSELAPQALSLLHRLAFEAKDYALVVDLAGSCYQIFPSPEMALRNAYASAQLLQVKAAVGWLHAAFQEGVENLSEIIKEEVFDSIRNDPLFKEFQSQLKKSSD